MTNKQTLTRVCHECGTDISHKRSNAWFCGDTCRQRSYRKEHCGVAYLSLTPAMAQSFKKAIRSYPGYGSAPDGMQPKRWSDIHMGRARRVSEEEFRFMLGHFPSAVFSMFDLADFFRF